VPRHLHLVGPTAATASRRASAPVTVVLAVAHAPVRRSLALLLSDEATIEVVAQRSDLSAAIRCARARSTTVLVIDLGSSTGAPADTIHQARARLPDTAIIALTMSDSPLHAQQAIQAGASGVVLKDRADSELLPAIRCAARDDEFVSAVVAPGLRALRRAVGSDGLSPRQTEVVRLIALGHTSIEIAATLRVSRRSIEAQRAAIYETLGVATRAELVNFALRRQLIGV
jgi:two-component system, NarL family, response regulator NreC